MSALTQKLDELAFMYLETTGIEVVHTHPVLPRLLDCESWSVETSSVARSSLDILLARRFNLKTRRKPFTMPEVIFVF